MLTKDVVSFEQLGPVVFGDNSALSRTFLESSAKYSSSKKIPH